LSDLRYLSGTSALEAYNDIRRYKALDFEPPLTTLSDGLALTNQSANLSRLLDTGH